MLKSMTAYGRSSAIFPWGSVLVEIQSVNRKYLEIQMQLPKEFSRFDADIRKSVQYSLQRGHISLKITLKSGDIPLVHLVPNLPLAREMKHAWDVLIKELQLSHASEFPTHLFTLEAGAFLQEEGITEEEGYRQDLITLIKEALTALINMRRIEGKFIEQDLEKRLAYISECVDQIAEHAKGTPAKYYEKLKQRLTEYGLCRETDKEERLLREIALYAERIDIEEEITRLRAHLSHWQEKVQIDAEAYGRVLEFLTQEMVREINTIGSKSADTAISHLVIEVKQELAKIAEQLQNIE